MATIKSYTDIPQSETLSKILSLESADMGWNVFVDGTTRILPINDWDLVKDGSGNVKFYHAWSLAALLDVLPIIERMGYQKAKPRLLYDVTINKWIVDSHVYTTDAYDNPVDACVELILKLNELNLL